MKRRTFLKTAGVGACGLFIGGCGRPKTESGTAAVGDRPNILWITCEDISPRLGCYGDAFAITPTLDGLASRGTRYDNAYSTAPVCAPARSCLITGVYATSLGTQHLRSDVELPGRVETLPEILGRAGYYCSNNYKEDYNFDSTGMWDESSHEAHWRKRASGQPFFSVFNFTSTHQGQINGTEEAFNEKYRSGLEPDELHDPADVPLPPFYPDTPFVRRIWARYYDLITYMDKQVADVLSQLEADGLADNTIIFFFSDHGFGLPRYKRTLYDTGLRVPFIVHFPDKYRHLSPTAAGGSTDRLVSFVDFAPTLLSILGMDVPEVMEGKAFLGRTAKAPRDYIFGASSRVDEVYEMSRCVRNKRYKYIRNYMPHLGYIQPSEYPDRAEIMHELRRVVAEGGLTAAQGALWEASKPVEELYDTLYDPNELNNLIHSRTHQHILEHLRDVLHAWMIETRDTGLMSEAEMHIRSEGSTPYETAHNRRKYPVEEILRVANLVGRGGEALDAIVDTLNHEDSAARYWAVVALDAMGEQARSAAEELRKRLDDESPNVRFAAAGVLCRLDMCDTALGVLEAGLDAPREETVLYAARELQRIGERACGAADAMRAAQARCKTAEGEYRNNNHAMFIDWALKYALENCSQ